MFSKMMVIMALVVIVAPVDGSDEAVNCPCVHRRTCKTIPYGSHVLDIAIFGIFSPCSRHGDVRCCPRERLQNLFSSLFQKGGSFETGEDCDCVPKGRCIPSLISTPSDCSELDELCCITNSDADAVFQLFKDSENELLNLDYNNDEYQDFLKQDTVKGIAEKQFDYILPCVPGLKCLKVYGIDPLDIAKFGSLPHCSRRGFVRCVELKTSNSRSSSHNLVPGDGDEIEDYGLPCFPVYKCHTIYGFDPLDIAKFGVLPHCTRPGFARCTQIKVQTSTSPILVNNQVQSSSPKNPSDPQFLIPSDHLPSPIVQYVKSRNRNKPQEKYKFGQFKIEKSSINCEHKNVIFGGVQVAESHLTPRIIIPETRHPANIVNAGEGSKGKSDSVKSEDSHNDKKSRLKVNKIPTLGLGGIKSKPQDLHTFLR